MSTVNALVAAARDGDVGQIKTLAKQCDINARDEIGWCAVHRAAVHGQVASLRCLVANGADLDAVDDDGWPSAARGLGRRLPHPQGLVELGAGVETACDATGEPRSRGGQGRQRPCGASPPSSVQRRGARRLQAHGGALRGVGGPVHMLRSLKSLGTSRAARTTAAADGRS